MYQSNVQYHAVLYSVSTHTSKSRWWVVDLYLSCSRLLGDSAQKHLKGFIRGKRSTSLLKTNKQTNHKLCTNSEICFFATSFFSQAQSLANPIAMPSHSANNTVQGRRHTKAYLFTCCWVFKQDATAGSIQQLKKFFQFSIYSHEMWKD